tara:strand:- start:2859 stop:3533 length:675 start_codon:yes stop_codon:yes gene_type:complete
MSLVFTPEGTPASPQEGEVYYDSTADKLKVRDASAFREVVSKNSSGEIDGTFNGAMNTGSIGSNVTGFTGIKMYDNWRLAANLSSLATPITSNIERNDTANAGFIGSAMTVSSGIWTFPQTGIYLIGFHAQFYLNASAQYLGFEIKSVISGSTQTLANGYGYINRTNSASTYGNADVFASFDVTDTSTHKIRFDYDEAGSNTAALWGSTTFNGTHFTFMRLGDT